MRDQLGRRISIATSPTRLINQIGLAERRCVESVKELTRLIDRAPRVLRVIRSELRKAFDVDPDGLLFTETKTPVTFQKVSSLTDWTLRLLVQPQVSININQFTVLSFKDQPKTPFALTPREVLEQVIALKLFARLADATDRYWQGLAAGSSLTRQGRWVQVNGLLFANRAFLARQLDEISSDGLAMVQALVDAPTPQARRRAGGDWASVQASTLMWPGVYETPIPLPGALHIYREGDPLEAPHVIYLPGLIRNFYQYTSFRDMQCGLLSLINGALFDDFWQCLPLSRRHELCKPVAISTASPVARGVPLAGDVLRASAVALVEGQWGNELACAVTINLSRVFSDAAPRPYVITPAHFLGYIERARKSLVGKARLGVIGDELLNWDRQRRRAEIIFASVSPTLPLLTTQQQLKRYERCLLALMDQSDLGNITPAYKQFSALENQYKVHADALHALTQGAQERLFEMAFWTERPGGTLKRYAQVILARSAVLRCLVELQHLLTLIPTAHRDLMIEVLDKPLASARKDSDTCVLLVRAGAESQPFHPLLDVFVVTTQAALEQPSQQVPVVLSVLGLEGGVATFASLDELSKGLRGSLHSRDGSVLWRSIGRDKREQLRGLGASLEVRYKVTHNDPVYLSFKTLALYHAHLNKKLTGTTRLFSEVSDIELSRQLLATELHAQVQAPIIEALDQAKASLDLVRTAKQAAYDMPVWLSSATPAQREPFKRLLYQHLRSALAFESALAQRLPDLDTFARRTLIARLSQDGFYPQLDIDQLLIDMPNDVEGRFCGGDSACPPGDRNEILTPTLERTRFTLLHLALHNLDSKAPYTRWRLNHARYLQPAWQQRLNADYLVNMIASLDIGGTYEALIKRVFYPAVTDPVGVGEGRIPALLNRSLQAQAQMQLFSAVQQGLSVQAQSLFSTAMAAGTPEGLLKNGHQLKLFVLHLVGHTMQHDRYIAGVVIIHDERSERCVVYWPDAPYGLVITEYASKQIAQQALNRLGASPDSVKILARQVAPGWAFDALPYHYGESVKDVLGFDLKGYSEKYFFLKGLWKPIEFVRSFDVKHLLPTALDDEIEKQVQEQITKDSQHWLAFIPTSSSDAATLLYRARMQELQRQTQAASNSRDTLDRYRALRLDRGSVVQRGVLSFFSPLFKTLNQGYELLLAARRYHQSGDPRDAVDVTFLAAFLIIDLLLNFVPGSKVKGIGAVPRTTSTPVRSALARLQRFRLSKPGQFSRLLKPKSASPITQLKPLEPFKTLGKVEDAIELKAPGNEGVYVKDGQHFVKDDTHVYPIYQRDNEALYRLKNLQKPGENELILNISRPREFLLTADAPVAGPSSGAQHPWASGGEGEWVPPARNAMETSLRQSAPPTVEWRSWSSEIIADLPQVPSVPDVFLVSVESPEGSPGVPFSPASRPIGEGLLSPERNYHVLNLEEKYYRLLAQGNNAPLNKTVFIMKDRRLVSKAAADIELWLGSGLGEQPVPATLFEGRWTLHRPLFDRPLEASIQPAFPTLTRYSRRALGERLIELADVERGATATHLLNIRTTLDSWQPAGNTGIAQTDDLFRMLRVSELTGRDRIMIGYEGKAPGFTRVDFNTPGTLDISLRGPAGSSLSKIQKLQLKKNRALAQQAAIKQTLENQGFVVTSIKRPRAPDAAIDFVCTHANSTNVYVVQTQWVDSGSVTGISRLSRSRLEERVSRNPGVPIYRQIQTAIDERDLVPLAAGVQWPTRANLPPTVYFIKPRQVSL